MADIFGGLVSYGLNRAGQERSFVMQKELQSDAQKYNTLMWNLNNQYNSAEQQMARFNSAGLNPNLIYGQMQNGMAAPTISAGSAPGSAGAPGMSSLETAQLALLHSQKKNIDADTENKDADTDAKKQLSNKYIADTNYMNAQADYVNNALIPYQKQLIGLARQEGLAQAIENWCNGYVPDIFVGEDGEKKYNDEDFAYEYDTRMNGLFDNLLKSINSQYSLDALTNENLKTLAPLVLRNDQERLNAEFAEIRANNAVLQDLSDERWFQIVNFIVNKLGGLLGTAAPITLGFMNAKTARMNAGNNALNAQANMLKAHKAKSN